MSDQIEFEMTMKDAEVDFALRKLSDNVGKLEAGFTAAGRRSRTASKEAAAALKEQQKEVNELIDLVKIETQVEESQTRKAQAAARERSVSVEKIIASERQYAQVRQQSAAAQEAADRKLAEAEGAKRAAAQQKLLAEELRKSDAELTRFAEHTRSVNTTPLERYQQQMSRLHTALAMGKLDQENFARATAKAREELNAARGATGQLVEEFKQVEIVGEQTFGGAALARLGQYAAGIATATAALAKLKEALEFAKAQRDAGAGSIKEDGDVVAGLAQLSGGDQKLLDARVAQNHALRTEYGLDRETAFRLQESAISNENEASMARFANTTGAGNAADRMRAASKLEKLSGGGINEVQADAAVYTASVPSGYTAGEFARAAPTAAEASIRMGSSLEEGLAVLSTMSDRLTSPEKAADRINRIQTEMARDERFRGKGLIGGLDTLVAMPEAERKKFMGESMEMDTAYNKFVENRAEIDVRRKQIETARQQVGTPADPVLAVERTYRNNPIGQAALEAAKAKQREEAAQRDALGMEGVSVENARRGLRSRALKRGDGAISRFAEDQFAGAADLAGGGEAGVFAAGAVGRAAARSGGPMLDPFQLWQVIKEEVEALKANAAATKANTAALNGGGRGRGPNPLGAPKK